MHPFESYDQYYGATLKKFSQNSFLKNNESGFCYPLLLAWQSHFLSKPSTDSFWKKFETPVFVQSIKDQRSVLKMPLEFERQGFRNELGQRVAPYGLQRSLLEQPFSNTLPKLVDTLKNGQRAVIIFMKDDRNDKIGHVIGLASKVDKWGKIIIGLCDANGGELLFEYSSLSQLESKQVWVDDVMNDTEFPQAILTFEDAVKHLLSYYEHDARINTSTKTCNFTYKAFYFEHKLIFQPQSSPHFLAPEKENESKAALSKDEVLPVHQILAPSNASSSKALELRKI